MRKTAAELLAFIRRSPSQFHAVENICGSLAEAGFTRLSESEPWNLERGGAYYTMRNHSSVIAFRIPEDAEKISFRLVSSHSDSPTFKVKAAAELTGPAEYLRLNVEPYGGMIDWTWLDRPLSIGGRVMVREQGKITEKLLSIDRDILLIPSLAIHMNKEVNKGMELNRQVDLCPLFSAGEMGKGAFDRMIAAELGCDAEDIVSRELCLVNRQQGVVWGEKEEFISSPKLDDLEAAFASLKGFLSADNRKDVMVYCCFDNEEVGSETKQGAASTFLENTLRRITESFTSGYDAYCAAVARSFMVSFDNAHAVHPNHPEKTDPENRNFLNQGIVIKENAAQHYTTDAFSRAVFSEICRENGIPTQLFANKSTERGGSTLGNISNTQVSLPCVDIGLPQLSMHSSYETAGCRDITYAVEAVKAFYSTEFETGDDGIFFKEYESAL